MNTLMMLDEVLRNTSWPTLLLLGIWWGAVWGAIGLIAATILLAVTDAIESRLERKRENAECSFVGKSRA